MKRLSQDRIRAFRRKIFRFYRKHGRHLPFRATTNPYRIAVAEIMLQQTQVERVIPKYKAWIHLWPDWESLAKATTRELLAAWSGLGYNRRAIYLGRLAQAVVERYDGRLPRDPTILQTLPGLGPYAANAILIFAFNEPCIAIDTNIRRVLIHELGLAPDISRKDMAEVARRLLPRGRSRDWHNALMDYSRLRLPKRLATVRPLSRQTPFAGSLRQVRGEIIRRLTGQGRISLERLARETGRTMADVMRAAAGLEKDGLVQVSKKFVRLV